MRERNLAFAPLQGPTVRNKVTESVNSDAKCQETYFCLPLSRLGIINESTNGQLARVKPLVYLLATRSKSFHYGPRFQKKKN
jgi:hypothetical protein